MNGQTSFWAKLGDLLVETDWPAVVKAVSVAAGHQLPKCAGAATTHTAGAATTHTYTIKITAGATVTLTDGVTATDRMGHR